MYFYDFVQNFHEDDTPLGDLAKWIEKDINFPKYETSPHKILEYFQNIVNLDHEIMEISKRSISVFEQVVN